MSTLTRYTHAEWTAEAGRRFGADPMGWRFVCPSCGHVAAVREWRDAGAPEGAVAFSCVGRWLNADGTRAFAGVGGPCNYAGGGFIGLNPVAVDFDGREHRVFDFAPSEPTP